MLSEIRHKKTNAVSLSLPSEPPGKYMRYLEWSNSQRQTVDWCLPWTGICHGLVFAMACVNGGWGVRV